MNIVLTHHAQERMIARHITLEDLHETLAAPDLIIKKHGKYYYRKKLSNGIVEACCERTESIIKVITVYWV